MKEKTIIPKRLQEIKSKNERTHGDETYTMGEIHSLYKVQIVINKMINKLEVTYETDKKGRKKWNINKSKKIFSF